MRLYVSVPLVLSDGVVVGTLCVFDTDARPVPDGLVAHLELLAEQAARQLEMAVLVEVLADAAAVDERTGAVDVPLLQERLRRCSAPPGSGAAAPELVVLAFPRPARLGGAALDGLVAELVQAVAQAAGPAATIALVAPTALAVLVEDAAPDHDLAARLERAVTAAGLLPAGGVRTATVPADGAEALEAALCAAGVEGARGVGTSAAVSPRRLARGESSGDIRRWARTAGIPVAEQGSLSELVISAYRAAHARGPSG